MTRRAAIVAVGSMLALARGRAASQSAAMDDWRSFEGSWSAAGVRQSLPTETGAAAAIVHLSGAVVFAGGAAGAGFTADVIGFDNGTGESTGRAVWTDRHGDRVFSVLRGGPVQSGRRIAGTITGGTGRWTGATGDYSLTWQYVVAGEADGLQGRSSDLRGRIRVEARR
jgi:hypothetical protein